MDHQHQHDDADLRTDHMDPAQQQLANALRASFRLLSFIMIIVVILFLLTGLASIDTSQVGVVTRFGKILGIAEEGLTYAWPFPVGRIEKLDISQQEVQIDDFWMFESPDQQRMAPSEGLRAGMDGALLTGDNNLYHVKLSAGYRIRRSWDRSTEQDPALQYMLNVSNPKEMIRSAVCEAAIKAASMRTADNLRIYKKAYEADVLKQAQKCIDDMQMGVELTFVSVIRDSWPVRVLPSFIAAQNAQNEMEKIQSAARTEAKRILSEAAGDNYVKLVGDLANPSAGYGKEGLINQFAAARDAEDAERQRKLLEEINAVLSDIGTAGETRAIISKARAESTQFVEVIKSRAQEFSQLLPKYKQNPDYMLADRWAETLQTILASPTVETILVADGDRKVVLITRQNPETAKNIDRERAKSKEAQKARSPK